MVNIMQEQQLLKEFGFTDYETKVYLALVQVGTTTAQEIQQQTAVPSNKVYASLLSLIDKGYVGVLALRPKQYKLVGISPFEERLEKKQKDITLLGKQLQQLKQQITAKQSDLQDVALVLKGKKKIIHMLAEASHNAQYFGYSFVGDLYFDYHSGKSVADAVKRGVEFRFLVHNTTQNKKAVVQWKKLGVKIRYYPKEEQKSIRFSTFDGKVCRITIGKPEISDEEDYLSFWIESPAFASLLKDQFEVMWKKSVDA